MNHFASLLEELLPRGGEGDRRDAKRFSAHHWRFLCHMLFPAVNLAWRIRDALTITAPSSLANVIPDNPHAGTVLFLHHRAERTAQLEAQSKKSGVMQILSGYGARPPHVKSH